MRAGFADCEEDCIKKALQFIGVSKSASIEKELILWRDYAYYFMGSIGFETNKRLMVIALAIAYWTIAPGKKSSVKNQMIVVPAA